MITCVCVITKTVNIMYCKVKLSKQILALCCFHQCEHYHPGIRWYRIKRFIQWWTQRGRVSLSGVYEQPESLEIWVMRRRGRIERSQTREILRRWFEHLSPWLGCRSLHTVGTETFFSVVPLTIKEASRKQNSELECFSHHVLFTA